MVTSVAAGHGVQSKLIALLAASGMMGLLTLGSSISGLQAASATGFSNLRCADPLNHTVESASLPVGTIITCKTFSTNPKNVEVHFWVETPTGTADDTGVIVYTTGTTLTYTFPADSAGQWKAHVNYYDQKGNADVIVCNMFVDFFVLPETSLGALGITGSSLAALGAFLVFKRRKSGYF